MQNINVYSEIATLKKVLLHRPGKEVENLTPELLERLLFDDIPYLKVAQEEHDTFANVLRENGVEVVYIEKLAAETLDQSPNLRDDFINKFIQEAKVEVEWIEKYKNFLQKLSNQDLINEMIGGTKKIDLDPNDKSDYPFISDPLPNVLFQRDPFASVGNGIILNKMWSETRNRETLFPDFVFKNHKDFKENVPFWYDRSEQENIEGGDVLVLNNQTVIIGVTQRTTMKAIEKMSKSLFTSTSYNKIICLDVPKTRSYMHLDTVFTNIDIDKFMVHPLIFNDINKFKIFEITPLTKKEIKEPLDELLSKIINKKAIFIKCGGDDPIDAGREQWNDGTNVLTISPGKVIAYERNWKTIDLMKKQGVDVITIPSSELSRGRGGPRCMSMPLYREKI